MQTKTTSVHNLIILDESGSMISCLKSTIDGFNTTLKTIEVSAEKDPGQKQFVSFLSFNSISIKTHNWCEPISNVKKLDKNSYTPDDCTPLYDAIGYSCGFLERELIEQSLYIVLVTIITDGQENSSTQYSSSDIKNIIERLSEGRWVFTYIGANHDAKYVAQSLSISNSMVFESDETGNSEMYSKLNKKREVFYSKLSSGAVMSELKTGFFDDTEES